MGSEELLVDEPLGHKLIKKGTLLYVFMFLVAPVSYVIKMIASNTLSVADVGLFYSVYGFICLLIVYHDMGLTEALQYYLPKYWINKEYNNHKTIFFVTLGAQFITGIIICLALYHGADWLALHHFKSPDAAILLKTFSFYFIFVSFWQVFFSMYSAFQDVWSSNVTDFARVYGILTFSLVFFFTNTFTTQNFAKAWILGSVIGLVVAIIIFFAKYKKHFDRGKFEFSKPLIKKQFSYAFWVFLSANAGLLLSQVDQQMIINMLGPEQAGYYTNYYTFIMMYFVVMLPVISLVFPIVSELIAKKDNYKFGLLQNILYKYFSVFALSIGGLFVALGPQIATVLLGSKFIYSGELLAYSGPFLIINILFTINYFVLAGLGKVKQRVAILAVALMANVILNYLFIGYFKIGLIGAVIAMIVGWLLFFILSYRVVNKNEKISFDWKFFGYNLLFISLLVVGLFFIREKLIILDDNYRYKNLIYMVGIVLIYYGVLLLINYRSIKLMLKESFFDFYIKKKL